MVDIPDKLFIEDKSAQGLYIPLPAGATRLTPLEWAEKQIFDKTKTRIEKLRGEAVATRAKKDGTAVVPKLSEFIDFKKLTFRIDADTPELRQVVEKCLVKLRKDFSDLQRVMY